MDNLYRMREAHKRMKTSEESVHPVTDEEMGLGEFDRTLSDIMQDKKEQDRFLNRFCYEEDSDMSREIAESLGSKTLLVPEQNKFLEKMRGKYNFRCAEIEQVQGMLDTEMIKKIADNDPEIQVIIGKIGPEKTAELLGGEFGELAMSNEREFKKMVKQMRFVQEIGTNELTTALNRSVQEGLSSRGISEEKYWEATKSGITTETQENLRKLVSEQYGGFKKAIDFISGNKLSRQGGEELYKNFEDQAAVLKECDKHMQAIGKVLRGTLTTDVSLAIQKAVLEGGEIKESKIENNVTTIDDYTKVKEWFGNRQQRWEQFKNDETKRLGIKDFSKQPDALDGMKDRFSDREVQEEGKYRGSSMLGILLALLFGSSSTKKDDIRSSLK